MVVPIREIIITNYVPFALDLAYLTFLVAGLVMLFGLYRHLQSYGIGLRQFFSLVFKDLKTKVKRFVEFGLGQRRVMDDTGGGVMHGALFYGFLMLLAYTTLIGVQNDVLPHFTSYVFMQGDFYLTLEFLGDTLGTAFVVGLVIALYRRYVKKLERLETGWDDTFVLGMLIWIGVSGFIIEALRFVLLPSTPWAFFSPLGDVISKGLASLSPVAANAAVLYQVFWFAHVLSVMLLIAVTPYTKLIHVITAGFNVALAPVEPMGKLETPFNLQSMIETGQTDVPPPIKKTKDFPPVRLLALDACTDCGRCQEVCPAYASGRDLSPRRVVRDLSKDLRAPSVDDVFHKGVIRESEIWACTMCNACVSVCPVFINQVSYITEFRRTLVSENRVEGQRRMFLENIARSGNPFGLPQNDRQSWIAELGVPTLKEKPNAEYLYWIGCQSCYDPRSRKVAVATIRLLKTAGVDFAVLGNEEGCTGEPVRRMGEEGRFQELALKNIETLKGYGVKKIIANCAHCYNTFTNEYPEFGGRFEVIHHTQLLAQLISEGRLKPGSLSGARVTFHDPCNLGRINRVVEEPRQALGSIGGIELVEMGRNKAKSFCCGAGGANMWYEVPEKEKVGVLRVREAKGTGAETIAVGCPFCITMFEDATKAIGEEAMRVKDIAELLVESMGGDTKS
jgi:Fe-S oxidoreductase/nitrate reductase gamma subunit